MFEIGDIVQLKEEARRAMAAEPGAKATVVGYSDGLFGGEYMWPDFFELEWEEGPLRHGQMSGCYPTRDFESTGGPW